MFHDFMQMGAPAAFAILAMCAVPASIAVAYIISAHRSRVMELEHRIGMRKLDVDQKVLEHKPKRDFGHAD